MNNIRGLDYVLAFFFCLYMLLKSSGCIICNLCPLPPRSVM